MSNDATISPDSTAPVRWRPYFLVGVLLFVLGPAIYAVQVILKSLDTPWHTPILATIGVLFMAVSVRHRCGVVRGVALLFFAFVCGLEWYFVAVAAKTPTYVGPAQPGIKTPSFVAMLSDGTEFTQQDLEKGSRAALVFFRGRW
jgi:hypothetical protein